MGIEIFLITKKIKFMKKSIVKEKSKVFALNVINLYKYLTIDKK